MWPFRRAASLVIKTPAVIPPIIENPDFAGRDEVVSTPAIETFGMNLLAGRHLIVAGSKHEILQEQDHYRGQFWAAFDAFVPGTPRF